MKNEKVNMRTLEDIRTSVEMRFDEYYINIKIGMFSEPVNFCLDNVTELHVGIINDLMRTDETTLEAVKAALLLHYKCMCCVADWGHGRGRDNPFNIHTPQDAWDLSRVDGFHICRPERFRGSWSVLTIFPKWELEHGAHIAFAGDLVHGLAEDYNMPLFNFFAK